MPECSARAQLSSYFLIGSRWFFVWGGHCRLLVAYGGGGGGQMCCRSLVNGINTDPARSQRTRAFVGFFSWISEYLLPKYVQYSTVRYSCCLYIARKCIIEKLAATVKDSNGRRRRQPLVSSGRPSAAMEMFLDDFRSLFQSVAFC